VSVAQFLDTNILILHLTGDHPQLSPQATAIDEVFDLYVNLNISFADAYHVVLMKAMRTAEIVSFDRHFDRVPGIVRVDR